MAGGDLSFDSDDCRKNICSVLVFEDDIGSISGSFNRSGGRCIIMGVVAMSAYDCL